MSPRPDILDGGATDASRDQSRDGGGDRAADDGDQAGGGQGEGVVQLAQQAGQCLIIRLAFAAGGVVN